jgi:hypothetical protein
MPACLASLLPFATGHRGYIVYLKKGTLETAEKIAAHESPPTTKLYDRTDDQLTLDQIAKISV